LLPWLGEVIHPKFSLYPSKKVRPEGRHRNSHRRKLLAVSQDPHSMRAILEGIPVDQEAEAVVTIVTNGVRIVPTRPVARLQPGTIKFNVYALRVTDPAGHHAEAALE
jgi:hypothetical protein